MSAEDSNRGHKFKTPFKKKQMEDTEDNNSCERRQQKRNKCEDKSSVETEDNETEVKPLIVSECGQHSQQVSEDTEEDNTEDNREDTLSIRTDDLLEKSDTFVFVSAKGEKKLIPIEVIQELSHKFNSLVEDSEESLTEGEDSTQVVPEYHTPNNRLVEDLFEDKEFMSEWSQEWFDEF